MPTYSSLPVRAENAGNYGSDVWPGDVVQWTERHYTLGEPDRGGDRTLWGRVVCSVQSGDAVYAVVLAVSEDQRSAFYRYVDPTAIRSVEKPERVRALVSWILSSDFPTGAPERAKSLGDYGSLNDRTLGDPKTKADSFASATRNVNVEPIKSLPADRYQLQTNDGGITYHAPGPGSGWTLPDGDVSGEVEYTAFPFASVRAFRAPVIDSNGGLYPPRRLQRITEGGYKLHGYVNLGGVKCRAFTSTQLFKRADGSLVSVSVIRATPQLA